MLSLNYFRLNRIFKRQQIIRPASAKAGRLCLGGTLISDLREIRPQIKYSIT